MDCTHFATFPLHSRRIGLLVNPSIYLEITLDRRTPATKIRSAERADQTRMRSNPGSRVWALGTASALNPSLGSALANSAFPWRFRLRSTARVACYDVDV